jgi:predicted N-acetyltransferase YhbS
MIIRPETSSDYSAIAEVNVRAFGKGREALIVSLHRHRREFDPELSLVAEVDGKVVGHALFSPRTIRLLDADAHAVCLGPIAVLPEYQGRGIGARLIEEGHRLAAAKGKELSFLIGHRTYYPRFGYRTNAYGTASATVPASFLARSDIEEAPVGPDDAAALHDLWRISDGAVDFAVVPGDAYLEWVSPNPAVRSSVFRKGEEIAGYVRFHEDRPDAPDMVLARDAPSARAIAAALASRSAADTLTLPIHPRSAAAAAFERVEVKPMAAAMAVELRPGRLGTYFDEVDQGRRPLGRVIWPVEFDS